MSRLATQEIRHKLARMRGWLEQYGAGAVRLRGAGWFAWATAGASNTVMLSADAGVAEVLVTPDAAYILTDDAEAARLRDEEVAGEWTWQLAPWAQHELREHFVHHAAAGKPVLSDCPAVCHLAAGAEQGLPVAAREERLVLLASEQERYRQVGRLAAAAIGETLRAARPGWTEYELAGAAAHALWSRGLQPVLVLAAGAARLPRYAHPLPGIAPLGRRAMLVLCARRFGLHASLSRLVRFRQAGHAAHDDESEQVRVQDEIRVMAIEAVALDACEAGRPLSMVYHALDSAYAYAGQPDAIHAHQQGGLTGYRARDLPATAHTEIGLKSGMALAVNPSLAGIRIEDTFLLHDDQLENLTFDARWPSVQVAGRSRPLCLELP
ncbi:M24 family metallopeptidase [Janthinobacterium agaricidamnosum]|uniref:Peptidase, M24 family n=1 Tax=Janthinobacterium agaricidamnosum NBRC 102515 = DSM 9628 TaxID=1349767 RepID=W0VBV7_9BURK|nr:M24 family metallopeptidase [Janthinobacterium agaricidamnosum]CDG84843.1 peptidase, M24 family [Janthinobacterium agaricidamnosum NBRC 102515 = DSM 9628]